MVTSLASGSCTQLSGCQSDQAAVRNQLQNTLNSECGRLICPHQHYIPDLWTEEHI